MQSRSELTMMWQRRAPIQVKASRERRVASFACIAQTANLVALSLEAIKQSRPKCLAKNRKSCAFLEIYQLVVGVRASRRASS
jgi:hypothetical protein